MAQLSQQKQAFVISPEEQAFINQDFMELLEATPDTSPSTGVMAPLIGDNDIPPNVRSLQFWFQPANPKKPLACSSHTTRSNACQTRKSTNTASDTKPTSATRQPSL